MAGTALGVFWEVAILRASCCCCCSLRALAELVSAREEKGGKSLYSHPAGRVGGISGQILPELGDRKEKSTRV